MHQISCDIVCNLCMHVYAMMYMIYMQYHSFLASFYVMCACTNVRFGCRVCLTWVFPTRNSSCPLPLPSPSASTWATRCQVRGGKWSEVRESESGRIGLHDMTDMIWYDCVCVCVCVLCYCILCYNMLCYTPNCALLWLLLLWLLLLCSLWQDGVTSTAWTRTRQKTQRGLPPLLTAWMPSSTRRYPNTK